MNQTSLKHRGEKQILKKHVSAIHIAADLTLLQRKLINALLYQSYNDLMTAKEHHIPSTILCEMIGFDSKNTTYLKAALKGLMETVVEFDLFDDDGKQTWEAMSLLPYVRLQRGVCTFRFDPALSEKLYHPDVYSKINLSVLKEMKSSHSLVLYENCHRYLNVGRTACWDVDLFRKLMGVEGKYKQFKVLRRDVIVPAMKEVNKLSNIFVELETTQSGRTVTGVQFTVKPNPQLSLLGLEGDDEISDQPLYKALRSAGISKMLARAMVIDHEDVYLWEKIELADDMEHKGKIKETKGAFLKAAIEQDYHSDIAEKRRKKEALEQVAQDRKNREAEIESLNTSLRKFENKYREHCQNMMVAAFEALEEAEAKDVQAEFIASLDNRFYVDSFKKGGWTDRSISPMAREFWRDKGENIPNEDAYAKTINSPSPTEIREKIAALENNI